MSDDKTVYFMVSAIRSVWLRRLVIVLTLPLFMVFNMGFAAVWGFLTLCENNAGLIVSARKQWRRRAQ